MLPTHFDLNIRHWSSPLQMCHQPVAKAVDWSGSAVPATPDDTGSLLREADVKEMYDLFKEDGDRLPTWVETVEGLPQLKDRLVQLTALKPGKYLIWDRTKVQLVEPLKIIV
jgi:hypothetical protein